jgi:hypothetical protein
MSAEPLDCQDRKELQGPSERRDRWDFRDPLGSLDPKDRLDRKAQRDFRGQTASPESQGQPGLRERRARLVMQGRPESLDRLE